MYDDRLEIESPGRLPSIVTVDNITHTRFSRNTKISRVLTEFELVRELNEGVKKIYADMDAAGLEAPEFVDSGNTFRMILKNSIDKRMALTSKVSNEARNEAKSEAKSDAKKTHISQDERLIIGLIMGDKMISQEKISEETGFSRSKVQRLMKRMVELELIHRAGAKKGGKWVVDSKF